MGKRKNNKKQGLKDGPAKLLPQNRNELSAVVNNLFQRCVSKANVPAPINQNSIQDWDEYVTMYELVEQIRKYEKDIKLPKYNRNNQIGPFMEWLETNDVKLHGIEIANFEEKGFGLRCTKQLKEGDVVLKVPSVVMMSEETAKKSYLGFLIDNDPILQHMGNIALSMHVLAEFVDPNSFWQPYLKILPSKFSNTLYFTPAHTKLLKGSSALDEVIKQFRHVARQYSYFYRLLQDHPQAKNWPIKDYFTFDNYRWAVSAVMTRINRIPDVDSTEQLALIPAWDMANHEQGAFSTDYDDVHAVVSSFAHRNFSRGDEYKIFYGQRSNIEFFLHSGFVYENNANNKCPMKFGVSREDSLLTEKSKLLDTLGFSVNGIYHFSAGKHPITEELLAFARIFCMDKDSLDKWNADKLNAKNLRMEDCDVGTLVQDKTLKFLNIRVSLLIRSYPSTIEDDVKLVKCLKGTEQLIRSYLIEEKKVLLDAASHLASRVK